MTLRHASDVALAAYADELAAAIAPTAADHDVVVAPYSLLQRDREHWLAHEWHLVVLDEALTRVA